MIIIGGGPSGLSTAYFLIKAGLDVLVIERGVVLGSKNVFGGRIYSYILDKYFDGWRDEAPIERWVRSEKVSFLCKDDSVTLEYRRLADPPKYDSFTAFLSKFVSWLGERVEADGGAIITGVKVNEMIFENEVVSGVLAGGERLSSDYVVIAEGANTVLSEKYGIRNKPSPRKTALGIKEVIRLDEKIINERFSLSSSEHGVAQFILGEPTKNILGGGFLYTMKNYVSIGLVIRLENIGKSDLMMKDVAEDLRLHPYIKNLTRDGTLIEYSAHLIREEGINDIINKPYGNGYLVVGDAAGYLLNTGFTIRGVDYAMESGRLAANTIIKAHEEGRRGSEALSIYKDYLDKSILMKSLRRFTKTSSFLLKERIYKDYPKILCKAFNGIYTVEEEPKRAYESIREAMGGTVSLLSLLKDLWEARGAL